MKGHLGLFLVDPLHLLGASRAFACSQLAHSGGFGKSFSFLPLSVLWVGFHIYGAPWEVKASVAVLRSLRICTGGQGRRLPGDN